jgi:hypothetical protein
MKIKTFVKTVKMLVGMLVVSLIVNSSLCGQSDILTLDGDNFKEKTTEGIVVVEYWASWNKANMVTSITEVTGAKIYRIEIDSNLILQTENAVIVVPTIVFYDDGKEYKRLQGDLSFTLDVTKKDLQKIIDEILLSKF